MNPELEFIFSRRSVRKYQKKEVPQAMIQDLLEAAMAAPSAVKKDPWHFIIVNESSVIDKIADLLPNAPMLRHAPVAMVVCGDINKAHDQQESFMLQDLSAAVENILLAANALGLGTCWLGVHPRQARMDGLKQLFNLPDHIIPMCGIAIGWPAESPETRTRFNPDLVHMEKW